MVPLILLLVLGVVEVSYATLDQHVVSKMTREGSNLISRDTPMGDAAAAMASMSTRPVNFNDGSSKLIFSVIKKVATAGAVNFDKPVLYQRIVYGAYPGSSILNNAGGAFAGAPDIHRHQLRQRRQSAGDQRAGRRWRPAGCSTSPKSSPGIR